MNTWLHLLTASPISAPYPLCYQKRMTPLWLSAEAFASPIHVSQLRNSTRVCRGQSKLVARYASVRETPVNGSHSISRRSILFSTAVLVTTFVIPTPDANAQSTETVYFTLPDLPYRYDALEPKISEQIMRAHHDAHFATYVKNLNIALNAIPDRLRPAPSDDAALRRLLSRLQDVEDAAVRTMLRNNGGGYLNHKQFFSQMSPRPRPLPDSAVSKQIKRDFGSFETFKQQFINAATTLFGSGFVWLVRDVDTGRLRITKYANQDNPAMDGDGNVSLLGCDCWEHAWYYQYGPKKANYINAWWELVDWPTVSMLYDA